MFWLKPGGLTQAERNIVYLCRPEVRCIKIIAGESGAPRPPTSSAHVDVDPNLLDPSPAASTLSPSASSFVAVAPKQKKHLLSSTDALFSELRENFAVVGSILNRTARRLNDDYERRHQAKTPAELRQFRWSTGRSPNGASVVASACVDLVLLPSF
jgi:hypothetical protein